MSTTLRVLLASPSDLQAERASIIELIQEINLIMGSESPVRFEIVGWETHTRPGVGSDVQAVVSQQLGDEYDIFLGMLWKRMGTPTSSARSGTEQEFLEAMERFKRDPDSLQILFYFKDTPSKPSETDAKQLAIVQDFQRSVSSLGVYYVVFHEQTELHRFLRIHLAQIAREYGEKWGVKEQRPAESVSVEVSLPVDRQNQSNPMLNEDSEEGLLDSLESGIAAFGELTSFTDEMTGELQDLGQVLSRSTTETQELQSHGKQLNLKKARQVVDTAANAIDTFADRTSERIPQFSRAFSKGIDAFTRVILIQKGIKDFDEGSLAVSADQVGSLVRTLKEGKSQVSTFRDACVSLPRTTKSLTRAKNHLLIVLGQLLTEYDKAITLTAALETTVKSATAIEGDGPAESRD